MNPATIIHNSLLTPVVKQRSKRGGCKYPFPLRLFDLLEYINVRKSELSHIISWTPHGKAFQVHDREAFEKQIQPKMFNQSKYASFNRQLNLWGFERIPNHHAGGPRSYFHPLFQNHDRELCCTMYRSKGPGVTSASPSMSTTIVSKGREKSPHSSSFCLLTTRTTRSDKQMTMVNGAPTSSLESRLRRTEQLLDHQQKQGYGQDSSDEYSPCTTDDKEFQDLIAFLSASDDNILKYLLES
jgi:hypothetical protein